MKLQPLLLFLLFFSFSSCKKEKPAIEQLPPITQTGAGTFGCLVDGKAFKPQGNPLGGPILSCAYQYIDGGYYFQLKAFNNKSEVNYSVGIYSDSVKIETGTSYILHNRFVKGKLYGMYSTSSNQGFNIHTTDSSKTGELKILKLDSVNRIISGTFWFDAVDKSGKVVEIREGRFDMKFSL